MADVGELFVRVRPDTAGFQEEAAPGVETAGTSLAKLFVAAFAAVGVGDIIKHTVEAAVKQQQAYQAVATAVKDVGAQHEVAGKSIDSLIGKQADLSGFSTTDLAAGFVPLVAATKSSAESFKLLGEAENLARARGISVSTAAADIAKAVDGSTGALSRYVVGIVPVTSAVQRLKEEWAQQADLGVILTANQKAQQAEYLKTATIQDRLATGAELVAALQSRFGGESAAFAKTAAGEWDIFRVKVDDLAVAVGNQLLPVLASGAGQLAKWASELSNSSTVASDAHTAAQGLAVGFHDVEGVVEVVGPLLLDVAQGAAEVVKAIGSPALLAAAAAYAAIRVGVAGVEVAQRAYNAVLVAGGAGTAAAASETQLLTAALLENTAALRGQAVAAGEGQLAIDGLAASEAEASASGGFAAGLGALATGPTAALIAVTALAGGVAYLVGHEKNWNDVNDALKASVQGLSGALQQQATASGAASSAAAAAVTAAEQEISSNLDSLTSKTESAIHTFGQAATFTNAWVLALDKQRIALESTDPAMSHNILLVEDLYKALGQIPPSVDIKLLFNNQDPGASLPQILSGLTAIEQVLASLAAPQAPPTSGQAASIYSARTSPAIAAEYAAQEAAAAVKSDVTGGKAHDTLTEAAKLSIEQLTAGIANADQQQADLNQQMQDAVSQGAISVEQAVQQAQQGFITIGQSIATDIGTYIDTPLTLAGNALQLQSDRIAAGMQSLVTRFATQNALLDQETNRISGRAAQLSLEEERASIELPGGHQLSTNPQEAVRQLEQLRAKASPAGKFALQQVIDTYQGDVIASKKAQEAIIEGAYTVKTAKHSADVAAQEAHLRVLQDMATNEKTAATNSINDWAAEWDTKKITLARFNADVAALIKRDVGSLGNVGSIPGGQYLEAELRGSLTGLGEQARAIQQGPQQAGAGFLPSIVHPLTALQNEQKQVASIAHSDAANQLTIQTDQRNILKQIWGAQKNLGGLGSLSRATGAQLRAETRAALAGIQG